MSRLRSATQSDVRLVVCDLSALPYLDLAGLHMLHVLHGELATQGITLHIAGAHGRVRDLLQADGLGEMAGRLDRAAARDSLLGDEADRPEPHRRR